MALQVEDMDDPSRFRQIRKIPYSDLIDFVLEYLRRKTDLMVFFWSLCILFLFISIKIRFNIAGYFPERDILLHTFLGLIIMPILIIPVHEGFHIVAFYLTGARKIRIGADLKQYIFYVTAHRHVSNAGQFRFVALTPFIVINISLLVGIFFLPGLWKWSLSLLLLAHTTMCAGDFALLNFFRMNRSKKIFTWDDADQKIAYFYEEI